MALKADYIEPDLCLSKDNVFMVMHDLLLDSTTDILKFPEFADRFSTKHVDGQNVTGFFINDFTQAELGKLTLRQRVSGRILTFNGIYKIPSFTQVMDLAQKQFNITGRTVGIYPELKHPSFYDTRFGAHYMEDLFLVALRKGGYATSGPSAYNNVKDVVPVVIQCFESEPLRYLSTKTSLPLIFLMEQNPENGTNMNTCI
jgi:glycerophosphoryl diester phosphodiesterase